MGNILNCGEPPPDNISLSIVLGVKGKYIGGVKEYKRDGKGTFLMVNGDKYVGDWHNDMKHGLGAYYYRNGNFYLGEWAFDVKEGSGKLIEKDKSKYLGQWRANQKCGKGLEIYRDKSWFYGRFQQGEKHGKGVRQTEDNTCLKQTWDHGSLVTSEHFILDEEVASGEELQEKEDDIQDNEINFVHKDINFPSFQDELKFEEKLSPPNPNKRSSFEKSPLSPSTFENKSANSFNWTEFDIGSETVSLIENLDMFASLDNSIIFKNVSGWEEVDVAEWLRTIGLGEYIKNFNEQGVNGLKLLTLDEEYLKNQLQIKSVGHRKNFESALAHLKKFNSNPKLNNSFAKKKIQKFCELNKKFLKQRLADSGYISPESTGRRKLSKGQEINSQKEDSNSQPKVNSLPLPSTSPYLPEKENFVESDHNMVYQREDYKTIAICTEDNLEKNAYNCLRLQVSPNTQARKMDGLDTSTNIPQNMITEEDKMYNFNGGPNKHEGSESNGKEKVLGPNLLINRKEIEIIEKIGDKIRGNVFIGKWLGQEVAVKKLGMYPLKTKKKINDDFLKEIEVISNSRHPNIVLFMGLSVHRSKYYLITEHLNRGSLYDQLHIRLEKIKEDKIFEISEDIALGMLYLHGRKVLHCDLRSSNVLIDSNWNIKICDFGFSKGKITYTGPKYGFGTLNWCAPEFLRGEKFEEASDVYSYGMILWEMVTGEIPYKDLNNLQIIEKVGFEEKSVSLPKNGCQTILKVIEMCLRRKKSDRPGFKRILEILKENRLEPDTKSVVLSDLKSWFHI